jgi:hypothetical protein
MPSILSELFFLLSSEIHKFSALSDRALECVEVGFSQNGRKAGCGSRIGVEGRRAKVRGTTTRRSDGRDLSVLNRHGPMVCGNRALRFEAMPASDLRQSRHQIWDDVTLRSEAIPPSNLGNNLTQI